jgi:RHS repeat-associated protein
MQTALKSQPLKRRRSMRRRFYSSAIGFHQKQSFTYNALGEVITQTDARNITSTTTYDKLGRKKQFTVSSDANGDGVVDAILDTWTYDPTGAKGQLSVSRRKINTVTERQTTLAYDALIRPTTQTTLQNTGGTSTRSYVSDYQYDSYYGRLKAQFLPNGEGEQFIYSPYGQETEQRNATSAAIYRQLVSTNARGQPLRELKGFNLATDSTYWPNGQLKTLVHSKDGIAIRKLNYVYDVFGNVATQELNQGLAGNTLESFSYDSLHRLTQSTRTGAANTTVTYGYDAAGNFNVKSDFSLATGTPYSLSTGGLGGGGANAVKSVALKTGGTRSYGYDASGNMTSDNAGFSAIYDHANLATKLQRGAVINRFTYEANNAKAKQSGSDGTKIYSDGYEEWITAGQTKVSLGNYAQVTNGTGGRVLHYFLTDRLGSVDAVTDGNGNLIETRGFDAFGAPRTGVWGDATQIQSTAITPKGFTSHEHLNSLQLIHMNGRMYDYQLGRFLGVDPFIQMPTNSQSLNPYSYVLNNPLSGTDPTGYAACGAKIKDGEVCEATVSKAVTDKKTGDTKTVKTTYTVANNGGTLFIAKGAGEAARGQLTSAINDFGGASKRSNIGGGFHAPEVAIGTTGGGPSRDALGDQPTEFIYKTDPNLRPRNPITQYFGDVIGAAISTNDSKATNYFNGDSISNPIQVRTWAFINIATLLLPAKGSGAPIEPAAVRFSQDSFSYTFKAGGTIDDLAIGLRNGSIKASDVPLVRLAGKDGGLFTLDNRRLEAFKRAGINMPYRMATPKEVADEAFKFTSKNGGTSARVRGE